MFIHLSLALSVCTWSLFSTTFSDAFGAYLDPTEIQQLRRSFQDFRNRCPNAFAQDQGLRRSEALLADLEEVRYRFCDRPVRELVSHLSELKTSPEAARYLCHRYGTFYSFQAKRKHHQYPGTWKEYQEMTFFRSRSELEQNDRGLFRYLLQNQTSEEESEDQDFYSLHPMITFQEERVLSSLLKIQNVSIQKHFVNSLNKRSQAYKHPTQYLNHAEDALRRLEKKFSDFTEDAATLRLLRKHIRYLAQFRHRDFSLLLFSIVDALSGTSSQADRNTV